MKILLKIPNGYALILALVFTGISVIVVAGLLNYSSSTSRLNERSNQYYQTLAASEAATEKIISSMERDFVNYSESRVYDNLDLYRLYIPREDESVIWSNFSFNDALGNNGKTYVQRLTTTIFTNIESQYSGLMGLATKYKIISNARYLNSLYKIDAALEQQVQLATIPIFQFAIFYSLDLEINNGQPMTIGGRVHGNKNLYICPPSTLTFKDWVTSAENVFFKRKQHDQNSSTPNPSVQFNKDWDQKVNSLMLPVGSNNTPESVYEILKVPPVGENPNSLIGKQRYYNKADLVVLVSNSTIFAKSKDVIIPGTNVNFISTNNTFYNAREQKWVKSIDIDISKLTNWIKTNYYITYALGGTNKLSSIYVADYRTIPSTNQSGVRVINGRYLPPKGLTIATPSPLYVKGHFNAPDLATTNTINTKPSSLVGDAITILSENWKDTNSNKKLSSYRDAKATTVNAAFLAGIVETSQNKGYSGGVENFPRFLEDWSGITFTYNGSMVVLFPSQVATNSWGTTPAYYEVPTRSWWFDVNFLDPTKLPPGTPQVNVLVRTKWAAISPRSI